MVSGKVAQRTKLTALYQYVQKCANEREVNSFRFHVDDAGRFCSNSSPKADYGTVSIDHKQFNLAGAFLDDS